MSSEWVLDASVLAKLLFKEGDTEHARTVVFSTRRFIAPDFIFVEFASIAAKKVRRGEEDAAYAADALQRVGPILVEVTPAKGLASRAFRLAAEHGVSVYDGLYLALAMDRDLVVLTADMRLVGRSGRSGLGRFVQALSDTGP
jgi:predicted nucleic acid-binding protein